MVRMKIALTAGLAILLILGHGGFFSKSYAQSIQADLTKQRIQERLQAVGFITFQPLPSWGSIVGTKDAAVNLSEGEVVYIQMNEGKNVKPGDRFAVMRVGEIVAHPVTEKKMGRLVKMPGEIVILEGKGPLATAKIIKSFLPVFLGDYLVPKPVDLPEVISIRPLKGIEAITMLSPEDYKNLTHKEWVFLDRGSKDGVIVGTLFKIYQRGYFPAEVLEKEKNRLPLNKVGEAVVIAVQEETSTALITYSSQAIYIGDRAVSGTD